MPTLPEVYLQDLFAQAQQDLAEAEQRREHQARVVSTLLDGTETRAAAEKVLREIDRTIAFIRANLELIQHILA